MRGLVIEAWVRPNPCLCLLACHGNVILNVLLLMLPSGLTRCLIQCCPSSRGLWTSKTMSQSKPPLFISTFSQVFVAVTVWLRKPDIRIGICAHLMEINFTLVLILALQFSWNAFSASFWQSFLVFGLHKNLFCSPVQSWQTFSVKYQRINTLGYKTEMTCSRTTAMYHEAVIDKKINE